GGPGRLVAPDHGGGADPGQGADGLGMPAEDGAPEQGVAARVEQRPQQRRQRLPVARGPAPPGHRGGAAARARLEGPGGGAVTGAELRPWPSSKGSSAPMFTRGLSTAPASSRTRPRAKAALSGVGARVVGSMRRPVKGLTAPSGHSARGRYRSWRSQRSMWPKV